jgi:Arc/MetJ family transcription regulator
MRTNIIIDDQLMANAMSSGAFRTKKEAVEEGLKLLARQAAYQRILALRGKIHWDLAGDWMQSEPSASKTPQKTRPPKKITTKATSLA